MTNNIPKPHKPRQDRYQKYQHSALTVKESSFLGNSVETTATLNYEMTKTEVKECRICLHDEDPFGDKMLYSVCKCTGSVRHLHEKCFTSWVNKSLQLKSSQQRNKILSQGSECQLCKQLIPLEFHSITRCASRELISFRIKRKPFLFLMFTVVEILCLIVIGFVSGMMGTLDVGFDADRVVNSAVMLSALVVLTILCLGVGYSYIPDYFMEQKAIVVGFERSLKQRKEIKTPIKIQQSSNIRSVSLLLPQQTKRPQLMRQENQNNLLYEEQQSQNFENIINVRQNSNINQNDRNDIANQSPNILRIRRRRRQPSIANFQQMQQSHQHIINVAESMEYIQQDEIQVN